MRDLDPQILRSYLLGRSPEAQRDELETRLLADADVHAAMLEAETDLIDDYARGRLDAGERRDFEARLLGRPGIAARLATARGLGAWIDENRGAERRAQPATSDAAAQPAAGPTLGERFAAWLGGATPVLRPALAAVLVVLLGALGLLAWQTSELRRQVADLDAAHQELDRERDELSLREAALRGELAAARSGDAETEAPTGAEPAAGDPDLAAARRRVAALEAELAARPGDDPELRRRPSGPRRVGVDVSFLLSLATRDAGVPGVEVPAGDGRATLRLDAGGEGDYYDAFQVRVVGPQGFETWSRTGLAVDAEAGTVDVTLPAQALVPGRYEALLEGTDGGEGELVGAYEFVVRRP